MKNGCWPFSLDILVFFLPWTGVKQENNEALSELLLVAGRRISSRISRDSEKSLGQKSWSSGCRKMNPSQKPWKDAKSILFLRVNYPHVEAVVFLVCRYLLLTTYKNFMKVKWNKDGEIFSKVSWLKRLDLAYSTASPSKWSLSSQIYFWVWELLTPLRRCPVMTPRLGRYHHVPGRHFHATCRWLSLETLRSLFASSKKRYSFRFQALPSCNRPGPRTIRYSIWCTRLLLLGWRFEAICLDV